MPKHCPGYSEWQTIEHALAYLSRADKLPHRTEAERVLLDQIPLKAERVLDLGTGDGRTLALVKMALPDAEGVALDFSDTMLEQARRRFGSDQRVKMVKHDLSLPLGSLELGCFDAVVSSLAIHHLADERKKQLCREVFHLLNAGGVFCNLDHVSSPSPNLHLKFLSQIGMLPENEDPSNKLLDAETQLGWLREIGFADVDCCWKWLELALLVGSKQPTSWEHSINHIDKNSLRLLTKNSGTSGSTQCAEHTSRRSGRQSRSQLDGLCHLSSRLFRPCSRT